MCPLCSLPGSAFVMVFSDPSMTVSLPFVDLGRRLESRRPGIAGFHTEGGTGGIYPPHDFGKEGISPPSNCRTVFFLMGILVKSVKKVFRRQIPFFSKFVFSNCLPV